MNSVDITTMNGLGSSVVTANTYAKASDVYSVGFFLRPTEVGLPTPDLPMLRVQGQALALSTNQPVQAGNILQLEIA